VKLSLIPPETKAWKPPTLIVSFSRNCSDMSHIFYVFVISLLFAPALCSCSYTYICAVASVHVLISDVALALFISLVLPLLNVHIPGVALVLSISLVLPLLNVHIPGVALFLFISQSGVALVCSYLCVAPVLLLSLVLPLSVQ
jgi:hypothetical protein